MFSAVRLAPTGPRFWAWVRVGLPLAAVATSLWLGAAELLELSLSDLWASLRRLSALQWAGSLAATALAFLAVAGQERAVVAHLGLRPEPRRARAAAMAAAAIGQALGFGPVVGAIVRQRLLPEITAAQSFAISATITLAFFLGLTVLVLASAALVPGLPYRIEATLALIGIVVAGVALYARSGPAPFGLRKPGGLTLLRLGLWLTLDCLALCLAFWLLLPAGGQPDYLLLLPVFLVGLGLGLASGSPAGAGPFEAAMALHLPGLDPHDLVASLLAFRCASCAVPALCGAAWALVGPALVGSGRGPSLAPVGPLPDGQLRTLARAEAQLVRQGSLGLVSSWRGELWVSRALAGSRLFLGDPLQLGGQLTRTRTMILGALDLSRREARQPCLYKVGPRTAATARAMGWSVLPVAREAVLDPSRFQPSGAPFARLRRKLRLAEKAGVRVSMAGPLPFGEMEAVAAEWAGRHGGERGVSMGCWARPYVEGQRVVLARDGQGRLLAFVTFHACVAEWTLDLIRSRDEVPDGTLFLLVCAAIEEAARKGVERLSLAAVPEKGFGLPGVAGRWACRLTRSSQGLHQFKSAFCPRWERRYLAAPHVLALVLGAGEAAQAIHLGLTGGSPAPNGSSGS